MKAKKPGSAPEVHKDVSDYSGCPVLDGDTEAVLSVTGMQASRDTCYSDGERGSCRGLKTEKHKMEEGCECWYRSSIQQLSLKEPNHSQLTPEVNATRRRGGEERRRGGEEERRRGEERRGGEERTPSLFIFFKVYLS
ncbi:unnamed protein product [Pleuronectes platessa]|uniref:Uncharacterized protein n=1 Tax=Pleuronectes platessa TaxID=8262 RepID=A0A9N7ULA6_PLEPL|nr:unnamed protein product [Pleuronectes platessa]